MPSFPEQLLTSQRCNKSPGNAPLPNWSGKNVWNKNVKLGVWIIQVEAKARVVVLDSELFSCRSAQTQYYTLTTPTGSCESKNERPNNTHLNLGGTQMSFLNWSCYIFLWSCVSRCFVYLFCCRSQYRMACELWSPQSLRHGLDRASGTLWTSTKTPACLHSSIYNLLPLIDPLRSS